jgi:hypothetical protein
MATTSKAAKATTNKKVAEPYQVSDLFYDLADAANELRERRFDLAHDLLAEAYAYADAHPDRPEVVGALDAVGKAWRRVYRPDKRSWKPTSSKASLKASLKADHKSFRRWVADSSYLLRTLNNLSHVVQDEGFRTESSQLLRVHAAFNRSFGMPKDEEPKADLNWRKTRRLAQAQAKAMIGG